MADFIDRQATVNAIGLTTAIKIDPIKTKYVDAQGNELVAVVRCRDCKWHENVYCANFKDDFYCAWGEKREDAEKTN